MDSVESVCSNRCVSSNLKCVKMTGSAGDLPSQIDPDLSSVIPGLNPVEYEGPLSGHHGHKEVEPRATETIPH